MRMKRHVRKQLIHITISTSECIQDVNIIEIYPLWCTAGPIPAGGNRLADRNLKQCLKGQVVRHKM